MTLLKALTTDQVRKDCLMKDLLLDPLHMGTYWELHSKKDHSLEVRSVKGHTMKTPR